MTEQLNRGDCSFNFNPKVWIPWDDLENRPKQGEVFIGYAKGFDLWMVMCVAKDSMKNGWAQIQFKSMDKKRGTTWDIKSLDVELFAWAPAPKIEVFRKADLEDTKK